MKLKVKRMDEKAILPSYAHPGDAGLDLYAIEKKTIDPGESTFIRTGITIQLPPGTEAQVRPRSGLALNHSVVQVEELSCSQRGEGGFGSTG